MAMTTKELDEKSRQRLRQYSVTGDRNDYRQYRALRARYWKSVHADIDKQRAADQDAYDRALGLGKHAPTKPTQVPGAELDRIVNQAKNRRS